MALVIIDYGSGNLRSAEKAFYRASQMVTPVPNIPFDATPTHPAKITPTKNINTNLIFIL